VCNSEAHFDRSFFRRMKGRTPSVEDELDIERTCVARESLILTTRHSSDELCLCSWKPPDRATHTHTHTHTAWQLYMTALCAPGSARWLRCLGAVFRRPMCIFLVLFESRVYSSNPCVLMHNIVHYQSNNAECAITGLSVYTV